jgi:hypothetical protein
MNVSQPSYSTIIFDLLIFESEKCERCKVQETE